jgi:hypothetical protein
MRGTLLGLLSLGAVVACSSSPPVHAPPRLHALVLVEASGGSLETETFVGRFLSVLSDEGLGNVADARLAGGRLETLRDASAPDAVRFRTDYPGDGYLGLDLPPCGYAGRATGLKCTASVVLLSPEGKELVRFETSASNSTGFSSESDRNPEAEASRAAAEKAARKLLSSLSR